MNGTRVGYVLPGYYFWVASYSGDPKNLPSAGTCGAVGETSHLVKAQPGITTQIDVTGAEPGTLGLTTLGDTATLSGAVGNTDGETVTFNLYGPYADGVTPDCATSLFTTTGLLSGGIAVASATYTPTAIGTYVWTATYPGDARNLSVTDACNQASEKIKIVGASIDVSKSANPVGPVSAADTIGFDISIMNTPAATATNVVITDLLPAGADLDWSLSPAFPGCAITGAVGTQTLSCTFATVPKSGTVGPIHITSPTTPADCGTVRNVASFTSGNAGQGSDAASVVVNCASVSLTKTADAPSVNAGDPIGYTVTAHNSGLGTARNVVISDPLPGGPGISWSVESGPASCTITGAPQVLSCTAVDLGPGASETVHVTSATAFASCGTYNNTATLTVTNSAAPDPAQARTVVECSSLVLDKVADAPSVDAGAPIGFTVSVVNGGPGAATGVVINDVLPGGPGVSWTIESGPANCAIAGTAPTQTLTCTAVPLASGASEVVHVVSATSFLSCATYDNTATLAATNAPAPPPASASTTVRCAALTLTKTADAATVDAGSPIGFTVTVTNSSAVGTGTARNVVINDPLPGGLGISWTIESGPAACSITGAAPTQTLHCSAVDLAPGGSETVHVVSNTAFASCATFPNTASLTATNHPSEQATASTTVQCPLLTVTKTADSVTVDAGAPIGFTIVVENGGPGAATAATLSDPLPAGPAGSGVNWSIAPTYAGPGTCVITGVVGSQSLNCAFGTLGAGASATVHIVSATTFASCADYRNTATAGASNSPDKLASALTAVQCPAPSLLKTADAASVYAGAPIGFTITAGNGDGPGTGTASSVVINDPLPAGAGISWTIDAGPPNCSITGTAPTQTLVCTAVDLGPGEAEAVHVTSATAFASCATYDNTATLTLTNGPPPVVTTLASDVEPISASATTEVQCAALALRKVADAAAVNSGSAIGFTIHVANAGPGTATAATIDDPLPAGNGVSWAIDPAYAGPGTCVIAGAVGSQVLTCALGDLASGAEVSVRVSSPTTAASCGAYPNTAELLATNAPSLTANASTTVNCAAVVPTPPVVPPPPGQPVPPVQPPLAFTGAGPLHDEIVWALMLVMVGALLVVGARRRRPN